jgi:hypothetical protein
MSNSPIGAPIPSSATEAWCVGSNEQIDLFTSRQLPRPLRDLIERGEAQGRGVDRSEIAREWVGEVGDRLARAALCQLILILACPVQVMWRDIGCFFEEAYGYVRFYGAWQSALAQAIGVPEPPVPDREEWLARWRPLGELLKPIWVPGVA